MKETESLVTDQPEGAPGPEVRVQEPRQYSAALQTLPTSGTVYCIVVLGGYVVMVAAPAPAATNAGRPGRGKDDDPGSSSPSGTPL